MKKAVFSVGLLLAIALSSCSSSSQIENAQDGDTVVVEVPKTEIPDETDANATDAPAEAFPLMIDTYTFDQLREADAGGCGMSLWNAGESPREDGILFFHGIDEAAAFMMFDGELQALSRTEASGEVFYGQQREQRFATDDGAIALQVAVTLGEPGEIESVEIAEGTITVETQGATMDISAVGDAGC